MSKRTFSDWAKAQKARDLSKKLITEEQFHMEVARRKHFNGVGRSAVREAVSLEILTKLREFQMRSHRDQATLLVITPLNGEGQTVVPITGEMDTDMVCQRLSNYYKTVFAEEELLKAEPIPGFKLSAVPKAKYRLDMYFAGQDLCLAETGFAQLSRKTLQALPSLVRLAQRLAKSLKKPDGIEVYNPKHDGNVKEYVAKALKAAADDPIIVPAYEPVELVAEVQTVEAMPEKQAEA